jgi:hypothetical protein
LGVICFIGIAGCFMSIAASYIGITSTFIGLLACLLSIAMAYLSVAETLNSIAGFYSEGFMALNSMFGSVNNTPTDLKSTAKGLNYRNGLSEHCNGLV